MSVRVTLAHEALDPFAELARFRGDDSSAGAIASFVGYCRDTGATGAVTALELEHYPGFTEQEIMRMASDVGARASVSALLVVHRVGVVAPGEAIVLVAAKSPHRAEAFLAVETLMDYLKTDAPFWKREHRSDGASWIEPTEEDRRRRRARDSEVEQ